jgi:pimeloyl-ACP methyl ester carboxylesterase
VKSFAQHHFITVQNLKTHFIRFGDSDQKVVFLHGWGGNTDSFFKLALELSEKRPDLELIIVDYPGFGLTDKPDPDGWDTHRYAEWVKAFCDELEIKQAHFYVHSFGGRILTRLMKAHPEQGQKLVFTGAAGIKWPLSFRQKLSVKLSKIVPKAKHARAKKLQNFIITKVFGARDWGNVEPALKATLKKVLAEPDFREDLKKISQKCLILWGEKDTITPIKSGKVYAENLPNNQFKAFKNGKHGIHHTHRKAIVEMLTDFL